MGFIFLLLNNFLILFIRFCFVWFNSKNNDPGGKPQNIA